MTPTLIDRLIAEEGLTTWMYRCSAGVVTAGVGHAMANVDMALVLPWSTPEDVVRIDFTVVLAAPLGYKAAWYAHLTTSRLNPDYVRQLLEADVNAAVVGVKKYFDEYDDFPPSAQDAVADLSFNLGWHWPVNGSWPKLTSAVLSQNWEEAAKQCHRKGISEDRNATTADLFRQAAEVKA